MSDNTLIYDTDALYGQHMDNGSQEKFTCFYKKLFSEGITDYAAIRRQRFYLLAISS
jgi:hypothetical protein